MSIASNWAEQRAKLAAEMSLKGPSWGQVEPGSPIPFACVTNDGLLCVNAKSPALGSSDSLSFATWITKTFKEPITK